MSEVVFSFSRAILQWADRTSCTVQTTFEMLKGVYEKYLHPSAVENCQLISDDGSENHGPVKTLIENSQHPIIQHLIDQRDIEFSNSNDRSGQQTIKVSFFVSSSYCSS